MSWKDKGTPFELTKRTWQATKGDWSFTPSPDKITYNEGNVISSRDKGFVRVPRFYIDLEAGGPRTCRKKNNLLGRMERSTLRWDLRWPPLHVGFVLYCGDL